jgi:hypothetical protein
MDKTYFGILEFTDHIHQHLCGHCQNNLLNLKWEPINDEIWLTRRHSLICRSCVNLHYKLLLGSTKWSVTVGEHDAVLPYYIGARL